MELGGAANAGLRRESQGSLNSSVSLDLGFLAFVSSKSESHRKSLGSTDGESESRPGKYCCVYLPDGTASLALARPGLTIRDMLAGICEKRGLSLPDIKVYLVGNEQKALVLDQDCTVLADQEVRLENRVTFELCSGYLAPQPPPLVLAPPPDQAPPPTSQYHLLQFKLRPLAFVLGRVWLGAGPPALCCLRVLRRLELAALERVVRISAKPTKRLQEALQPILEKHGLSPLQVTLHRVSRGAAGRGGAGPRPVPPAADLSPQLGEKQPLDMGKLVSSVATQRLVLDTLPGVKISKVRDKSPCRSQAGLFGETLMLWLPLGLVELLNRVQSSGAHDQRGLLRKEDLVLPEFLQLPTQGPGSQETPPQTESAAQPSVESLNSTAHSAL
ncbi:Regulator of G-protein signaling 14 [Saguinus oedipus]|uniref:Regulator of G-protein signaling 14 n=1 Tax=Saguinus oedipus TaxID=9490 RepID=A0ABQ9WA59_SAGOE|nr:Regulator of G-protein signaling 14 [Saguinus oedipus]